MADSLESWLRPGEAERIDTPALLILTDRVQANIVRALEMVGGDTARLRPHVKTHKSSEATRLMLDAGITQFKCATIAEAEMLAQCGAPDVLLAYQPNPVKLDRLVCLMRRYPQTRWGCLFDNAETLELLESRLQAESLQLDIWMDLDVGMHRTGIAPGDQAVALYLQSLRQAYAIPVGLHAYDGHLRHPNLDDRRTACEAAFAPVWEMQAAIGRQSGHRCAVIAGGSPAFAIHCANPAVVCSPGTFVYWDQGYGTICAEQPFEPAALLLSRVVSLPNGQRICVDLGHKSVAAESDITRRVHWLNAEGLTPVAQSEEHLVLEASGPHDWRVGDLLIGVPWHVCPTVALFERAVAVTGGRVSGEWHMPARDRSIGC